jgi:hypothetical protein
MDVSYDCELNLSTNLEATSFKEATSHDEWKEAMHKEYDALINNGTWKLVDPPIRTKLIGSKWVFNNNYRSDGSLDKQKERLMEKGFACKEGVDYEDTYPAQQNGLQYVLYFPWQHRMDVKTAFLNGYLKENIFMSHQEGFVVKGQEHKVWKIIKSLYGMKQAPSAWYEKLTDNLLKLNFKHFNLDDATLFVNKVGKNVVYLVVYVDDMLITCNNENYIASIKKKFKKGFEMKDLGHLHYYLSIEIIKNTRYIFISHKKYIE